LIDEISDSRAMARKGQRWFCKKNGSFVKNSSFVKNIGEAASSRRIPWINGAEAAETAQRPQKRRKMPPH